MLLHLALAAQLAVASPVAQQEAEPRARAEALWVAGERTQAIELLAAALAAAPDDRELRARLVERELSVQRFAAALEHAGPLGEAGAAARGQALYFLARYEEALPLLDAGSPELLPLRVESLRALGRVAEMEALIPACERVLGAEDPRTLCLRGRREARRGAHAAAAELFRAALAADPLHAEARFGLGRSLLRAGQREQGLAVLAEHRALLPLLDARDHAQRGVALSPRHAANQAALGDAWRALLPFDPGALERAERCYAAATALAPPAERTPVALRRARLWSQAGQLERALEVLRAAGAQAPDARLHVRAGDLLAAAGRTAGARAEFERALELRPGDPAIQARLEALDGGEGAR